MNRTVILVPVLAVAMTLVGCKKKATYIDPAGPDTIVSLDQVDIQDFGQAAASMTQSLLSSGELAAAPRQPAVLGISRVVNDTTQRIDTDELVKKIRVALNQSGKVRTVTTYGLGEAEDPLAQRARQDRDFYENTTTTPTLPDYTLSGKILERRARAGDIRQVAYIFQLSLTDVRNGLAVWEEERTIVKQGEKPAVGW